MTDESECKTRAQRINPLLEVAGWTVARFKSDAAARQLTATAVGEYPTATGPADYAFVDASPEAAG